MAGKRGFNAIFVNGGQVGVVQLGNQLSPIIHVRRDPEALLPRELGILSAIRQALGVCISTPHKGIAVSHLADGDYYVFSCGGLGLPQRCEGFGDMHAVSVKEFRDLCPAHLCGVLMESIERLPDVAH